MPLRLPSLRTIVPVVLALLAVGCAKKTTGPKIPTVNVTMPNANRLVVAQTMFGDSSKANVIWELAPGAPGVEWYTGRMGNANVVGRLGDSGARLGEQTLSFTPVDLEALGASSAVPGGAIVTGYEDASGDGRSDRGHVDLLGADGARRGGLVYASDSSRISLHRVASLSDSLFVVSGQEIVGTRTTPLLVTFALTPAGALEERDRILLTSIPSRRGWEIAVDPADAGSTTRRIYLSTYASSGPSTEIVHGVDIGVPGLSPCTVAWSRPLVGAGAGTSVWAMKVWNGALYAVGIANDPGKGPPSGDNYWHTGIAARYSLSDGIGWVRLVRTTAQHDQFLGLDAGPNGIFAIGDCAMYANGAEVLGYGWVVRLAPEDGTSLSNFIVGEPSCQDWFSCGYLAGSTLHLAGGAQMEVQYGASRAWWCALSPITAPETIPASDARPRQAGDRPFRSPLAEERER